MKRIVRQFLVVIAVLAFVCFIPVPFWNMQQKGIDGYYAIAMCCCGDICIELDNGRWYETSPGHKYRKQRGEVRQSGNQWELVQSNRVVCLVEQAKRETTFTVAKNKDARDNAYLVNAFGGWRKTENGYCFTISKVRNPWRIWLQWIWPE